MTKIIKGKFEKKKTRIKKVTNWGYGLGVTVTTKIKKNKIVKKIK